MSGIGWPGVLLSARRKEHNGSLCLSNKFHPFVDPESSDAMVATTQTCRTRDIESSQQEVRDTSSLRDWVGALDAGKMRGGFILARLVGGGYTSRERNQ
ncbi:hypothetical protein BH23CHL5_BH23CHL5_22400 [soil metagenome]